jgi:tetratricopeptide (TPR) repeat protein
MTTKEELQEFFYSAQENWKYIQMYEENIIYFNGLLQTGRVEEIEFVLPIKLLGYVDPLNKTGNYSKALKVLDEVDKDLVKLKGKSKEYKAYKEFMTFLKGVCLGRLKHYKASNKEFRKLLTVDPDNEKYLDWYRGNQKDQIYKVSWPLVISGMTGYLMVLGLEFALDDVSWPLVRSATLLLASLALVIPSILMLWINRTKPKKIKGTAA